MGQVVQYAKLTVDAIKTLRDIVKLLKENRKKIEQQPIEIDNNKIDLLGARVALLQKQIELQDRVIDFLDSKVLANLEHVIKKHDEQLRETSWLSKTNERMVMRLWKKAFPNSVRKN